MSEIWIWLLGTSISFDGEWRQIGGSRYIQISSSSSYVRFPSFILWFVACRSDCLADLEFRHEYLNERDVADFPDDLVIFFSVNEIYFGGAPVFPLHFLQGSSW